MGFKVSKDGKVKIILIIAILFILFVVFSIAAIVYTERPEFCTSCHIMDPYYDSWKESAHAEVNCIECHYDPGLKAHIKGKIAGLVQVAQYLTGRYSEKPNAEVSDVSCLRGGCHKKEELKAKKIEVGKSIEFSHDTHFGDLGKNISLRCTTCHMQLTYDEHVKVERYTCFVCHFNNVEEDDIKQACLVCHMKIKNVGEHKDFIEGGMTCYDCHERFESGEGYVSKQVCYFCHADNEDINMINNKEFLHQKHTYENKVDCISCHDFIKHN